MTGSLGPSFDPARIEALRASLSTPSTPTPGPARPTPTRPTVTPTSGRPLWQKSAPLIIAFAALLYVIEFIDVLDKNGLDDEGIRPRTADGLWGILWAPLLHYGWPHLIANTIPLLVLGFLALMAGIARGIAATGIVWIVGGVGTWLTGAAGSVHLGASVLVFGWLTFLVTRGLFTRKIAQILLGLALLAVYGGILWGVLPGASGISWQGHLFGAVGGVVAAWLLSSDERDARRERALPA